MPEVMDWDAAYRDEVFAGPPPWNIGETQPAIAELIRDGKIVGDVLDVGCGIGDVALDLASRGYRVVGIDVAAQAIAVAVKAAGERGLSTATFVQGDITSLTGYDKCFDTVLDCLLLHSLPVEARDDYLRWAHRAAKPGATMYVLVLTADALPADSPFPVPNLFSQKELREIVDKYWKIDEIRPAFVHVKLPTIPDLPVPPYSVDDKGRAKLPASLVCLKW
ncbi:class I SAM-dependent methyltransferase [Mycobacterium decipiens]|nr:class I SAM-dependent methyltransferase [Mycobacterium decipiens]